MSDIDRIFRELGMDKKPAMIPPPPKDQSNARLKVGACGKTVFPSENMAKKTARKRIGTVQGASADADVFEASTWEEYE